MGKKLKKLVEECESEAKELSQGQQETNEKSDSLKEVNE